MIVSRLFATPEEATEAVAELMQSGFRNPAITVVDKTTEGVDQAMIMKLGIQPVRSQTYVDGIGAGGTLVVVDAPPGAGGRAADILNRGEAPESPAAFEALTREPPPEPDWTDATPLSRALGWRVLLNSPTPFSDWIGGKVLSDKPTPLSSWLGRPALSDNPAPLSSWLGWKLLLNKPAPLSDWAGRTVLLDEPAPLSKKLNRRVLSDDPTPLSNKLNSRVLSDKPTPLSSWLNLPVLSGDKSDRT
jgi:hypothetical protein